MQFKSKYQENSNPHQDAPVPPLLLRLHTEVITATTTHLCSSRFIPPLPQETGNTSLRSSVQRLVALLGKLVVINIFIYANRISHGIFLSSKGSSTEIIHQSSSDTQRWPLVSEVVICKGSTAGQCCFSANRRKVGSMVLEDLPKLYTGCQDICPNLLVTIYSKKSQQVKNC